MALGPIELNGATVSSRRSTVPLWLAGADREHPGCVARRRDSTELLLSLGAAPQVSSGGDDHDPCIDCPSRRQRERVGLVGLVHPGRHRQVDDPDVVRRALLDRVVDCGDGAADESVAVLVERLEHDEVGAGRDPPARPVRIEPAAGDDAGDVRAVPVAVVRLRLVVDEVHELHDPIAVQVVVRPRDAGVDDGDADAGSVDAEVLSDPPGADRGPRSLERAVDSSGRDSRHARQAGWRCRRGSGPGPRRRPH